MARPVRVLLLLSLVVLAVARPAFAQPFLASGADQLPEYRGPSAFYDPEDPLHAARWTLGNTLPERWFLKLPSTLALHRLVQYEPERGTVLLKYLAGQEEMLPPLPYSPAEYAEASFDMGLRRTWVMETGKSLNESLQRGGTQDGLINLDLPNLPFASKVFGDGAPNLRVRGSEQITISGSSSWVVGQVTGEQGGNSLFPKLDMRQRLNVSLDGTIGSKLSVSMAQNSDALTPLENSIKIRYKGLDDEVLKSVELGNTNLSLPSTQFISYSTRQEGLFGVKTEAEVGGVSFTAIASREQGESGRSTFNGGSAARTVRIPDWNYVQGKYFFLIDPNGSVPPPEAVTSVRLYLDDRRVDNNVEQGALPAKVWIDPEARLPETPATGMFHALKENQDYYLYNDTNLSFPRIQLTTTLDRAHTLAVAYIQQTAGVFDTVGTWWPDAYVPSPTDSLDLKMLRPSDEQWGSINLMESLWAPVRSLEAKNVYSLLAQDIEQGSLTLNVVRDIGGEAGSNPDYIENDLGQKIPLLQVLGLDQKNNLDTSNRTPDTMIDPEFVDLPNGLLIFPDLRPFDPDLADIEGTGIRKRSWPRLEGAERPDTLGWRKSGGLAEPSPQARREVEVIPEIYDLMNSRLSSESSDHHRYTIEAQVRAAVSSTIDLGVIGGGILQNSETVRLNGEELHKGEDYTIDYEAGIVTLKNAEAVRPGADLVITYSKDALFARGSKSLFGASVATGRDLNSKFSLSSTWLHESHGTPDRRPRLLQEPTRTTVGDFAGKIRLSPWLLTDLVDMLPLVKTNMPSRFELTAATGVSFPNPNTRGEVFIDDMEGAEQVVSPGVNRVNWIYSSTPVLAYEYSPIDTIPILQIEPKDQNRGQLLWFSPPNAVQLGDITPREDSEATRNDPVPVLEVIYVPSDSAGEIESWAGLSTSLLNADVSRKQYLEVWLNDNIPNELAHLRRGELLIDIGEISEDAVWDPQTPPDPANGLLDREDKNDNRGQVEVDEDRGLDFLWNTDEPARDGIVFTPKTAAQDPAGDDRVSEINEDAPEDFIWQRVQKYQGVNGTQENQRLDTEDLDDDYTLDSFNNYREYRISLADSAFIDNRRDFNTGSQDLNSGWRMYRIPFSQFSHEIGSLRDLTQVKSMRMWFRGIAPGDTLDLQVASIEIVGNNWELADPIRADELVPQVFSVGIANNKEDVNYREPFEVRRIDNQKEKEQSIALNFENFQPDSTLRAFRRLPGTDDYTLYQTVGFYLNPRFQDIPGNEVEFYMRFGSDATNDSISYYEVATRLTEMDSRRSADGWINVEFNVSDLSQFKIGQSTLIPATDYLVGPGDVVDSVTTVPRQSIGNGLLVTVRGNPSMSRVRRLSAGLRNVSGVVLSKGTVWYDELRMGTVRRDMGWAGKVGASMTLADFADLQGSVDLKSPDFLRLGESRGSGTENLHYDLRGQVGLHKFVEPLHLNMPVQFRTSRQRLTPKFIPNNDILYDGSNSTGDEITQMTDRGIDVSLSRDGRGLGGPLLRYTVDALRFSGSYGEAWRDDVLRDDLVRRLNASANYNLSLGDIGPLRPLGLVNMWLWPRNVQLGLTAGRIKNWAWSPTPGSRPDSVIVDSKTSTENLTLSTSIQPISGLTYNFASDRDLIDGHFGPDTSVVQQQRKPLTLLGLDLGRPVSVNHNLGFVYSPPLMGRLFSPRFTWTGSSNQSLQPSLTLEDYDHAVYDIGNTDNTTVSLTLPLGQLTEKFTRKPPPGKATRPNRPKRGANADTTQAQPKQSGDAGQFFTKVLRLRDIQTTGSLGHQSNYRNVYGEPDILYRVGFTRHVGDSVFTEPNAARYASFGRTWTARGTTGLRLLNQVDVDVSFNKRYNRSNVNGRPGPVTNETTWPDLRFDWGELQKKLPLIRRLSDFRIVNTSFNRTTNITGTTDNPNESKSVSNRWSPLISVQGTLPGGWKTQLNANISSTKTVSQRGGASTVTDRSQNQYTFTLNKKFESGRGTSAKDVDVKVDLSYSNNSTETQGRTLQADKQDQVRLNSTATLRLTRALSGTFGFEVGQERRPTSDWTRRSVRVSFTTGFNF